MDLNQKINEIILDLDEDDKYIVFKVASALYEKKGGSENHLMLHSAIGNLNLNLDFTEFLHMIESLDDSSKQYAISFLQGIKDGIEISSKNETKGA